MVRFELKHGLSIICLFDDDDDYKHIALLRIPSKQFVVLLSANNFLLMLPRVFVVVFFNRHTGYHGMD
jgi:hypothetical protein